MARKTTSKKTAKPKAADKSPGADVTKKATAARAHIQETFGKITLSMLQMPRYRHLPLSDLQSLVLDPLLRDRIAIAFPKGDESGGTAGLVGIAFWASVSAEVDAKIREQIKAGVFPIRLQQDDWRSGDVNWLIDIIATNRAQASAVISNFRSVVGDGELRIHPLVGRMLDKETLEKMGARPAKAPEDA